MQIIIVSNSSGGVASPCTSRHTAGNGMIRWASTELSLTAATQLHMKPMCRVASTASAGVIDGTAADFDHRSLTHSCLQCSAVVLGWLFGSVSNTQQFNYAVSCARARVCVCVWRCMVKYSAASLATVVCSVFRIYFKKYGNLIFRLKSLFIYENRFFCVEGIFTRESVW